MVSGLKALGEKQVNFSVDGSTDGVAGTQADPAVTALSNGDFVVVYENPEAGSNIDLLAHFFDSNGNAIGPPVSSGLLDGVVGVDRTADVTLHPAVAATPDGGFLVAYTDATATDNSIVVRRYDDTTGMSAPFVIDSGAAPMHQPNVGPVDDAAIAAFADGTSVVVWEFDFARSATDHDVYFAFLNSTADGFTHTPAPLDVHNGFEGEARAATSGNLAAIVYAADPGTINGGQDVILTLFNSSATEVAAPSTIFGAGSSDIFSHPDVAALSDGRFAVVARDDTISTLVASIYDPVTHVVTPLVNFAGVTGAGTNPHVAGTPGGGFVVSLDNPTGDVTETRFGPGGSVLFNADVTNSSTTGAQDQNAIAANASGTVFFAWQDAGSGNPNSTDTDTRIEAQAFHLQQLPQPNFNGDGNADILLQNGQQLGEWQMSGTSVIGGGDINTLGAGWAVAGTGDFDGDGRADILLANGQLLAAWEMNGTAIQLGSGVINTLGAGWSVAGTGDFDGDGHADILLRNGQQLAAWEMNGTAIHPGSGVINTLGAGWSVAGTGDFDGDGRADILLQNGQQLAAWEMNGTAIQSGSGVINTLGAGWSVAGTGDFDGDGHADILLQNGQQLAAWEMNGTTIQPGSGDINTLGAGWSVAGTGDFNGDGHADILLQNGQQLAVWEMNGTQIQAGSGLIGTLAAGWGHVS